MGATDKDPARIQYARQINGFALVGEFESLEEARNFYKDYREVDSNLQFEADSDTVELYQVWVQQTSIGNYAKLLVTDIQNFEGEREQFTTRSFWNTLISPMARPNSPTDLIFFYIRA